ncbi:hypothetical protein [Ornithinimicrobium cerasi]|uniref:hypothetical protein n=1 Tax=Ornithinimicrobium cerasi TaxID=2248773 RepID=UPI000F00D21C|nr:hypothetical protein [Ornithinimicrobium cerasi]
MGTFKRIRAATGDPRQAVREGGERGIVLATEHIAGVATQKAPIEEGILRGTGAASQDGLVGAVSFDTPYAARQHEELDWNHPRGGEAKYLENAMNQEAGTARALIAQAIRDRMEQ